MIKAHEIIRASLLTAYLVLASSMMGCSSDSGIGVTSSTSTNPLPQPSVNCNGSSCIN